MLPRLNRLRREQDILMTIRRGRAVHTPWVRLHLLPQPQRTSSRVAGIVGVKVDPSAVVRHRYQRWLRECARQTLRNMATNQSYDMVWIGRPALKSLKNWPALYQRLQPYLTHLKS